VVEHKQGKIAASTLNTVTAASKLGHPITALVAGSSSSETDAAAKSVAQVAGISKVLVAKHAALDHNLAEAHAPVISHVAKNGSFTHVVTAHSAYGKNVFPRAAALLDVSQVSDVIDVESADTFKRPIYAGKDSIASPVCVHE
jgi:electron transfer flavoprotein alpha subunit